VWTDRLESPAASPASVLCHCLGSLINYSSLYEYCCDGRSSFLCVFVSQRDVALKNTCCCNHCLIKIKKFAFKVIKGKGANPQILLPSLDFMNY
jgi:hypothetical protein